VDEKAANAACGEVGSEDEEEEDYRVENKQIKKAKQK
jgi:hypothetical protein